MEKPSANKLAKPKIKTIVEDKDAPITPVTNANVVIVPSVISDVVTVLNVANAHNPKSLVKSESVISVKFSFSAFIVPAFMFGFPTVVK